MARFEIDVQHGCIPRRFAIVHVVDNDTEGSLVIATPNEDVVRRTGLSIVGSIGEQGERIVRELLNEESSIGDVRENLNGFVGGHVGDERGIGQILVEKHVGRIRRDAIRAEGDGDHRLLDDVDVDSGQSRYGVGRAVGRADDELEDRLGLDLRQIGEQA